MSNTVRIHKDKQSLVPNYIAEWAEKRGLRQTDLVRLTGIDKGHISKWWTKTVSPTKTDNILALAHALGLEDEPERLFRDPDDDWFSRFFQQRTEAERERAIEMLKLMFPDGDIDRRRA